MREKPFRSYQHDNNIWTLVTFELSLDRLEMVRTVYSLLDVLASIGGVTNALMRIITFCVMLLIYNYEKYMFSTMIYSRKELQDECIKQENWDKKQTPKGLKAPFKLSTLRVFKLNII